MYPGSASQHCCFCEAFDGDIVVCWKGSEILWRDRFCYFTVFYRLSFANVSYSGGGMKNLTSLWLNTSITWHCEGWGQEFLVQLFKRKLGANIGEEDLILVWMAVGWRRLRQAWSQVGMAARECLMSAFLCQVQGVEMSSLLEHNGKIQCNSQPDADRGSRNLLLSQRKWEQRKLYLKGEFFCRSDRSETA